MASRRGDLERAARLHLSAHIGEVGVLRLDARGRSRILAERRLSGEMGAYLEEGAGGKDPRAAREGGFSRNRLRDHERAAVALRAEGHRERSADRPQLARQGELAGELERIEAFAWHLPGGGENADRDRQVEPAAFLGKVGGPEVHRGAARGEIEPRPLQPLAPTVPPPPPPPL